MTKSIPITKSYNRTNINYTNPKTINNIKRPQELNNKIRTVYENDGSVNIILK